MDFDRNLQDAREGSDEALHQLIGSLQDYIEIIAKSQASMADRGQISPSTLVQHTNHTAIRKFRQFRGESIYEMKGWLRRITMTAKSTLLRDPEFTHTESGLPGYADEVYAQIKAPHERMANAELRQAIDRAMALLTPAQQLVVELHYRESQSFVEIARYLGTTQAAAGKLWARALVKMGPVLEKYT